MKTGARAAGEEMVTLTILLHPPEKSRVGRVRYCQHHGRGKKKKKTVYSNIHIMRILLYYTRDPRSPRCDILTNRSRASLKLKSVKNYI